MDSLVVHRMAGLCHPVVAVADYQVPYMVHLETAVQTDE